MFRLKMQIFIWGLRAWGLIFRKEVRMQPSHVVQVQQRFELLKKRKDTVGFTEQGKSCKTRKSGIIVAVIVYGYYLSSDIII